jgi:hypothetical protein
MSGDWRRLHRVCGVSGGSPENHWVPWLIHKAKTEEPKTELQQCQTGRLVGLTGLTGGYLSYGLPWAHYLGGYQNRLLGGPLGLPGLRYTAPEGVEHKDYTGVVLG